ncbi:hypothetical protein BRAS3843_1750006 [Bradyrhizobium sp. STM 3843]|nr:hypothetical protein BRAS3843_1750006 [Bradyrhizobium sp. STM 3843]
MPQDQALTNGNRAYELPALVPPEVSVPGVHTRFQAGQIESITGIMSLLVSTSRNPDNGVVATRYEGGS